jgi:hypothetical protein
LQQAIWHCGSSACASKEITGAGPNSRINASPITCCNQPAYVAVRFIL